MTKRILRNAKAQEGEYFAEDPEVLIKKLERITGDQVELIQWINRTNSNTLFSDWT